MKRTNKVKVIIEVEGKLILTDKNVEIIIPNLARAKTIKGEIVI